MNPAPVADQVSPSGIATAVASQLPRNDGQTPVPPPAPTPAAQQVVSSGHPEVKAGPVVSPEVGEIEAIPESPEISPELAEHVERVVRGEIELPGPIDVGVHEGQPVTIEPSISQQPNIVLPLTRADFTAGLKQPVSSSWRWLYEWVRRVVLMFPGKTLYRQ